tara:strand:- start:93 stop:587 length:495 start_codon:yes stop_codon:yes gene_type:complete
MSIILKNKDTLVYKDFIFKCSIGKNGLSTSKVEGDQKTPIGTFSLDKLYYRHDRTGKPKTKLKCISIKKNMGWCDDPKSEKNYNKLINIKQKVRYEKMYRFDRKYDLLIPIKYNFLKPKLRKGSAIFLHITKNFKPTAGCIAIKESDFLILLRLINKKTKITIK